MHHVLKYRYSLFFVATILLWISSSAQDGLKLDFEELYILHGDGVVALYDLESQTWRAECSCDLLPMGCFAPDKKVIYVSGASSKARMWRIECGTMRYSEVLLQDLAQIPFPTEEVKYAPSVLQAPAKGFLYYGTGTEYLTKTNTPNTTFIDINTGVCKPVADVYLPSNNQIEMSPDGTRILVISNPISLIASPTGRILKSYSLPMVPTKLKNTDEFILHGVMANWRDFKLYLWRTRKLPGGNDKTEQARLDLNTGKVDLLQELAPWPLKVFHYVDERERDFRSPLLFAFERFGGDLRPRPFLTAEEANAFARLRNEWIENLHLKGVVLSYLSPTCAYLIIVEPQEAPATTPSGTQNATAENTYFSRIIVLNTHTGQAVKTITTKSPVSQILMR